MNYGPSYVCALKGTTVKISCVLNYPRDHELTTAFWSKTAVTDGETSNLCSDPENKERVQCDSEDKDTYRITLTSVTEADKHIYYCRFTTNRGRWTGIPGAQLDVTGRDRGLSEIHHTQTHTHTHTHTDTHARTHTHTQTHTHARTHTQTHTSSTLSCNFICHMTFFLLNTKSKMLNKMF